MQLFQTPNFDFIRWRWYAIGLSLLVIIAGLALVATRGVPLGIDFSGGTIVIVKFDQPVTAERVRQAVFPRFRRRSRAPVWSRVRSRSCNRCRKPDYPASRSSAPKLSGR